MQKCSPGSTFRELSSEGWLFQEKGARRKVKQPERRETTGENRRRDQERLQSEEDRGERRGRNEKNTSETRITAQEEKKRRIRLFSS